MWYLDTIPSEKFQFEEGLALSLPIADLSQSRIPVVRMFLTVGGQVQPQLPNSRETDFWFLAAKTGPFDRMRVMPPPWLLPKWLFKEGGLKCELRILVDWPDGTIRAVLASKHCRSICM